MRTRLLEFQFEAKYGENFGELGESEFADAPVL